MGFNDHALAASTAVSLPSAGTSGPEITIIIVTYNTRELTIKAVRSLLSSPGPYSAQIIVVDNGSHDGTADSLENLFPKVLVIRSVNEGFAAGNNRGFEHALGRFILVLNPDTEVNEFTISSCVEYMTNNREVGVLGCRVVHADGKIDSTIFRLPKLRHMFFNIFANRSVMDKFTLLGDPRYAALSREEIQDVEAVAGCFMLVRREVIEQVGGMDERFFMYSEETEWCFRIRNAGWTIRYYPGAEVMHHGGASTRAISRWVTLEVAKGQILYFRITAGDGQARVAAVLMVLRDWLRLGLLLPLSLVSRAARTQRKSVAARLRFAASAMVKLPRGQITRRVAQAAQ